MTTLGLLVRTLACFGLVFATWNPTGYSYLSWIHGDATLAAKSVAGAALLALHVLFARITWLSLGPFGVAAATAVLVSAVFALSELGAVDLGSALTRNYLSLMGVALLLATGVTWSLVKRRV